MSRNITRLDIEVQLLPPPEIVFLFRKEGETGYYISDDFQRVEPGYWRPEDCSKISGNTTEPLTHSMQDDSALEIGLTWWRLSELHTNPCLLFTMDGSDPRLHGITVRQREVEGELVNDYAASANVPVLLEGWRLPLTVRVLLVNSADPSEIWASGTGVFTNVSSQDDLTYRYSSNIYWKNILEDIELSDSFSTPDMSSNILPNSYYNSDVKQVYLDSGDEII